jgi:hypothetical protein
MMSAAAPATPALEAQIAALGDEIRALKAAKGSKEEVKRSTHALSHALGSFFSEGNQPC